MGGEPYCFNCGTRTDIVTEDGDAICRTCQDARTPPVPGEGAKPAPRRKAAGVKSKAKPKAAKRG